MQKRKKLLWRIYPSYLLITLLSLMIVAWHAPESLRQFYLKQVSCDLKVRALLFKRLVEGKPLQWSMTRPGLQGKLESKSRLKVDKLCKEIGPQISTRITVILPSGVVVGDSQEDLYRMDNQAGCPEFQEALTAGVGTSTRYDFELKKEVMHIAIAVEREGEKESATPDAALKEHGSSLPPDPSRPPGPPDPSRPPGPPDLSRPSDQPHPGDPLDPSHSPGQPRTVAGVIRASMPLASIGQAVLGPIYLKIAFGVLFLALVAGGISLIISRLIDVPLEEMEKGANRFASGDLDYRLPVWGAEELVSLGETMNRMAARVGERIRTITQEKNEIETVLSSMDEAVLVMDMNERIIRFNQAAACLFDVTPSTAQDRSIQEVIRNTDLQRLVTKTLSTQEPQGSPVAVEGDIILYNGSERFLQAHGTILRDLKGEKLGALIVLNDITRLKVLENVRRDFVANVSHELKTPITSIKGFVETLKEGAMNYPEDRIRFLDIIARHADRLNAIIEDLLSLSRIEQDAEREQIVLSDERIKEAIDSAILVCSAKAHEKGIKIDLTCDEGLKAKINLPLLEQAVVNLIDNAIKYSGPEGTIRIEAAKIGQETIIKVCDWGCGIPKEHLPRIFERFYRVDKARSRKLGGTGLGLAIVKHIVHAHGGRITVESAPDKGSTFSICLPDC